MKFELFLLFVCIATIKGQGTGSQFPGLFGNNEGEDPFGIGTGSSTGIGIGGNGNNGKQNTGEFGATIDGGARGSIGVSNAGGSNTENTGSIAIGGSVIGAGSNEGGAPGSASVGGGSSITQTGEEIVHMRHYQTDSRKKEDRSLDAQRYCRENCINGVQCYFPHEEECNLFYRCYGKPNWIKVTEVCAFGTYFNDGRCYHSQRYNNCPFEKCRNTAISNYTWNSEETCNRAYWVCDPSTRVDTRVSEPRCCPAKQIYDPDSRKCREHETCNLECPLSPNERCRIENLERSLDGRTQSLIFAYNHTNCREFYVCDGDIARQRCCKKGQRYVEKDGNCTVDNACEDTCTEQVACMYEALTDEDLLPSTAGPNHRRYHYFKNVDGGSIPIPCAPGTIFKNSSDFECPGCYHDKDGLKSKDCKDTVRINFRSGTIWSLNSINAKHVEKNNQFKLGEVANKENFGVFNTKAALTIYGYAHTDGEAFKKGFHFDTIFLQNPLSTTNHNATSSNVEVLLSSCPDKGGDPLRIVLRDNNVEATVIRNDTRVPPRVPPTKLTVPYEPSGKNRVILSIRIKSKIMRSIELTVDPDNKVPGKEYTQKVDFDQNKGLGMKEIESELMVGGCPRNNDVSNGFNGYLYKIEIAECFLASEPTNGVQPAVEGAPLDGVA